MKRICVRITAGICVIALSFAIVSCGGNKKNEETGEKAPTVYVDSGEPVILDEVPLED